jgi:hypothetical protein
LSPTPARILLSELKTARLICRACRAVVELPVDRLDQLPPGFPCPICRHLFPRDHLAMLARAFRGLEREGQAVEFVVERNGPQAAPPAPTAP